MSTTETTPTTKPSLEQEVAAWSKTDADLHALVKATEGVTIAGHVAGEKKGREVVHSHLMTLVKARTSIEGRKAELKRPALDLCNLIETEAKRLLAIPAAREAELRKERDEWDAAQAKIEADRKEAERLAARARLESRVNAMTAAGIPVDLVRASDLSDEDWADYLAKALDAKAKLDAATKVADELTALGDECTPTEALQLTDEQIEHRLGVGRKADHDRREVARIQAEEAAAEALRIETERQRVAAEEKATRERLERGYRRGRELALLGAVGHEVEPLADMTEEAFQVALETARQEKVDRDARVAEERRIQDEKDAELARLKKDEADRLERERVALEAREREAKEAADKAEADAKAARQEAEREVRHHGTTSFAIDPIPLTVADLVQSLESQEIEDALSKPSWSVQVGSWFAGIRTAIEASPDKDTGTLAAIAKMLNVVKEAQDELLPF
jgi:hypothetical protein